MVTLTLGIFAIVNYVYIVYVFWCVLIIDFTNVKSLFRSLNKCESMKHNVGLTMSV